MQINSRVTNCLVSSCNSRTSYTKLRSFICSKEMIDEVFSLKNPSEAVEEVETLPEEFYNKPLILEKGRHRQ